MVKEVCRNPFAIGFPQSQAALLLPALLISTTARLSPLLGVHGDGPWLTQLRVDQHPPLLAVPRGYGDGLVPRVSPVEVLVDPVNGQPFRGVQGGVNQGYLLGGVTGLVDVSTIQKHMGVNLVHQKQVVSEKS